MSPMSPVQFNTAVALRHCMYKSPPKNYPPLFIVLDRSPIHLSNRIQTVLVYHRSVSIISAKIQFWTSRNTKGELVNDLAL